MRITSIARSDLIYVQHLHLCSSNPPSDSRSVKGYSFCDNGVLLTCECDCEGEGG